MLADMTCFDILFLGGYLPSACFSMQRFLYDDVTH